VFNILAFNPGRSLSGRWVEYDEAAPRMQRRKRAPSWTLILSRHPGAGRSKSKDGSVVADDCPSRAISAIPKFA
jgi:hypothetical protein